MPTLIEQREALLRDAVSHLKKGDARAARKARTEAQKVDATIKEMAEVKSLIASTKKEDTPKVPDVVLPTNGDGAVVKASDVKPEATGGIQEQVDYGTAAYQTRFGEQGTTIKAILTDLHGPHFEGKYWDQRMAFAKYLRRGDKELDANEYALVKEIVLTPTVVETALRKGMGSVKALKATMVESVDSLGGFTVPVDFQARIIERMQGLTVMRGRASEDTTGRDMVEIPTATGGDDQYTSAVRVSWVEEVPPNAGETNLTFGMENVPIHTSMAETPLSRNLIEDSAFDIEDYLSRKFAEASSIDEDNKFLAGLGTGTPQGILPGGINALGLTAHTTAFATISWDDLIDLSYSIHTQYRSNAVWIANRNMYATIAKMKSAANDYLWTAFQYQGGADGAPLRLLGYEVLEQEQMVNAATNTFPMIFGDLSGYQIFDRVGMTVERYLDSETARRNRVMFVMRRRVGAQVTEPWKFAVLSLT